MMRRSMTAGLIVGLLATGAGGAVLAQDEMIGADLAYYEQVEVPEAGIALAFPPDWNVDIEMDQRQDFELTEEINEGEPVYFWNVLYASPGGGPWCDLVWWPDHPLPLDGQSLVYEWRMLPDPDSGVERTVETTPVDLGTGEAYRFDVYNEPTGAYTTAHLFESGSDRYLLSCEGDTFEALDDLEVVETIGFIGDGPDGEPITEPVPVVPEESALEGQRVEVPEAGIAVSFPDEWEVEVEMYRSEMSFSDPEGNPIELVNILYATPGDATWCDIASVGYQLSSLAREAQSLARTTVEGEEDTATADFSPVRLSMGQAYRVDKEDSATGTNTTRFLFDGGPSRFTMTCMTDKAEAYDFLDLAQSLEILGKPPAEIPPEQIESAVGPGRVEVPEAGLALTLPQGWVLEMKMEMSDYQLPDDADDGSNVSATRIFSVYPGGNAVCGLSAYEPMPMSLERHAWETGWRLSSAEPDIEPVVTSSRLPVGEVALVHFTTFTGRPASTYIFDLDGVRYGFECWAETADRDAWQALAETFESLAGEPPSAVQEVEVPEEAVAWDEVRDYGSVVPVTDEDIEASLMGAWCDRALWIAYADDTFEERFECTLTDEPVDPPEWQAAWPAETVTVTGGECEWVSDFWTTTDGSEVWATAYALTVDPDGRVIGTADYAAELLECE